MTHHALGRKMYAMSYRQYTARPRQCGQKSYDIADFERASPPAWFQINWRLARRTLVEMWSQDAARFDLLTNLTWRGARRGTRPSASKNSGDREHGYWTRSIRPRQGRRHRHARLEHRGADHLEGIVFPCRARRECGRHAPTGWTGSVKRSGRAVHNDRETNAAEAPEAQPVENV